MTGYELHYWPSIQGRGEFVRLALEAVASPYRDIARGPDEDGGVELMLRFLNGGATDRPPFAPPFLKAGNLVVGQTANILMFLGARHDLAPPDEAGRLWANQLQLTIADMVVEIHDTHHPIASGRGFPDKPGTKISALFRAHPGQQRGSEQLSDRRPAHLSGSVAVPDYRGASICLSAVDGRAGEKPAEKRGSA